jgi:outer membrane immunogenic protein
MKKVVFATVLALAASGSVYAGGFTAEPASADYSWTGFYVGVDGGYMWGHSTAYDLDGFNVSGNSANNPFGYNPEGGLAAAHVGYQRLIREEILLGVEAQGGWMGLSGSNQYPPYIGVRTNDSIASVNSGGFGALSGRLGIVIRNHVLFYGKGGYAWTGLYSTYIDTNATGITLSNTTKPSYDGWLAGGGIEYAFNHHWSARLEYDHYDFGKVTSSGLGSNGTTYTFNHTLRADAAQAGVSYLFHS